MADATPDAIPRLRTGVDEAGVSAWFQQLGQQLQDAVGTVSPVAEELPFCGGLLGVLNYDAGQALNHLDDHSEATGTSAQVRAYRWAVVQDHLRRKSVLATLPRVRPRERAELLRRLRQPARNASAAFALTSPFQSNFSDEDYRRAFARIQAYIHAGDCYQVNLAQRFTAAYEGDPWLAYKRLRAVAAAPFSAYLEGADSTLLCLSPERFLALHGHRVETSPIKGTRPRYDDRRQDEAACRELRESDKDRAENLMIVDLLRNDLGRSCVPGSIHVDRLFDIQSFPTVHHMVSTISGELAPGLTGVDLLRILMSSYCGSVFYLSADGRMDSNIAIRTLLCRDGDIHCWGGGGIVADSAWQLEYQETFDKVGAFLSALEESLPSE